MKLINGKTVTLTELSQIGVILTSKCTLFSTADLLGGPVARWLSNLNTALRRKAHRHNPPTKRQAEYDGIFLLQICHPK